MKKHIYLIPLALFGLVLTGCSDPKALPANYSDEDKNIPGEWVDYEIPATGLVFEQSEYSKRILKGEDYTYHYFATPKAATPPTLEWESSDESVVTVEDGTIHGVNPGSAIITVNDTRQNFLPVHLEVEVAVLIENFTVSEVTHDISWNRDYAFEVTYEPSDTTQKVLDWKIPEEEQHIATISDGVLHTKGVDGTVHVHVKSPNLKDKEEQILTVNVHKVHVSGVSLEFIPGSTSEVEVDNISTVQAIISPSNAEDASLVTYKSSNPEIARVDASSGIIVGVEAGTAKITATCEGIKSSEVEVTVKEAHAIGVHINESDVVVSNQPQGGKALTLSFDTDESGYSKPSREKAIFYSSDPDVITVDQNGNLTAVSKGVATITAAITSTKYHVGSAEDAPYAVYSDSIEVTSEMYATKLTLNAPVTMYSDETVELNASLTPNDVSLEDISWSISPETAGTITPNGRTATLAPNRTGPIVVTASMTGIEGTLTDTKTVSVTERPVYFEDNVYYLVGSSAYKDGESTDLGGGSWGQAKYAFEFVETTSNPDAVYEYKGTINFRANDLWKIKKGSDGYKDIEGWGHQGEGDDAWWYRTGEYKVHEGAFATGDMEVYTDEQGNTNIKVINAGKYDIYYAWYNDKPEEQPEGWYSIAAVPHGLKLSSYNIVCKPGEKATITASEIEGTLQTPVIADDTVASMNFISATNTIEITGVSEGKTTLTVKDSVTTLTVPVTITNKPTEFEDNKPYLVGNRDYSSGTSVNDGTSPWGSDPMKSYPFIESTAPHGTDVYAQFEATVTLSKNDEFQVLIGKDYWDANYESAGAVSEGQITLVDNGYGKLNKCKVVEDGTYKIYAKCLANNNGWSIYIEPHSGGGGGGEDPSWVSNVAYLVGNKDYHSGVSASGESWNDITKAFTFIDSTSHPADMAGVDIQYYGQITFEEGDLWRLRIGSEYNDCVELSGAFGSKAQMAKVNPTDPYTNYIVNTAGTYELYVKYYTNGTYGVYVADIETGGDTPEKDKIVVYFDGLSGFGTISEIKVALDSTWVSGVATTVTEASYGQYKFEFTMASATTVDTYFIEDVGNNKKQYYHTSCGASNWDTNHTSVNIGSVAVSAGHSYKLSFTGWEKSYDNWEHAWFTTSFAKIA